MSARTDRARARRGFTLVELLLVMFVMTVLVGLVVGVGRYVLEQGRETRTRDNMKHLVAGIMAYREVTGEVPPAGGDPNTSLAECISYLKGENANQDAKREIREKTMPALGVNPDGLISDAWKNTMRYYPTRGAGGSVQIISAGPDGRFGERETHRKYRKDNVTSDTSN